MVYHIGQARVARCASCAVVDSDCTVGGKWETMLVVCVFVCLIATVGVRGCIASVLPQLSRYSEYSLSHVLPEDHAHGYVEGLIARTTAPRVCMCVCVCTRLFLCLFACLFV